MKMVRSIEFYSAHLGTFSQNGSPSYYTPTTHLNDYGQVLGNDLYS